MFTFNKPEISDGLDLRIIELIEKLKDVGDSEEHTKLTSNLAKLMDLRNNALKTQNEKTKVENDKAKIENDKAKFEEDQAIEHEKLSHDHARLLLEREKFEVEQELRHSWKPSPDAVVGAAASVLGIVLVLHYEKIGVITSKALGFIGKMTK